MNASCGAELKWSDRPRYGSPTWKETPTLIAASDLAGNMAGTRRAARAVIRRIRFIVRFPPFGGELRVTAGARGPAF
jgi:hypothetical protein